jgi:hypothetical protein
MVLTNLIIQASLIISNEKYNLIHMKMDNNILSY